MNNLTLLTNTALLFFVSILFSGALLLNSTNLSAQPVSPEQRCYNKKLRASGSHVRCLLRAQAKADSNSNFDLQAATERCDRRFERRFNNAEAQAAKKGAMCPSQGGVAQAEQNNLVASITADSISNVKSLSINIAEDDLAFLQSRSLNLNIALKVNGEFDVIWRSVSDYTIVNSFQWSPVFHIFGTDHIAQGEVVDIDTNVVTVTLGQDVVMEFDDLIDQPVPGNAATGITFINNSDSEAYPGLAQLLSFDGSTEAITPVYVSETPIHSGQSLLITPAQEIVVWFGPESETGVLISEAFITLSNFVVIDFTDNSTIILQFEDGEWTTQ